jgi:diaminobutyrate-2-oxoglutarate transaminase
MELPAAEIVETVQGEGGLQAASIQWLAHLRELCDFHGVLLILDDIQVGCGRTGPFFSFEPAGITPDIICLSKSLSGYGLPLALTLIRPEVDVWEPGEHSGTFRGNNHAFVTATKALDYWTTDELSCAVERKAESITAALGEMATRYPEAQASLRGRGMIQGLYCAPPGLAQATANAAFERGLIVETSGPESEVVKLLPPLTIDDEALAEGLGIIASSLEASLSG